MKIPKEVKNILQELGKNKFEAYIVGGCVRDLLLNIRPKDWDITTNARPEQIQKIFPESVYENAFGTVGVKTDSQDGTLKIVEVTTFRVESKYSDKRHPDEVTFSTSLKKDLSRRDFTVNALALSIKGRKEEMVDLFEGEKDLKNGIIRAVGDPEERFAEDALRMMRALRLATALNFTVEDQTFGAIKKNARLIDRIAKERIRDEFTKMMDTPYAHKGILFMQDAGLLQRVLPEIAKGIGVGQNKHHIYTVFEHNLYALKWAEEHDYPLHVKFAALYHDVGKPQVKRGDGSDSTFYGHEVVGARITVRALDRLHFSKQFIESVALLVRHHLFYYNVGEVTERSVRRLVAKVGPENMADLVKVRICDRMGSGVPKPEPYRLRHFQYMVEKVQKDPLSVGMLKVRGDDVLRALDAKPGPRVGQILATLLDDVLDDPALNTKKHLMGRVKELGAMSDKELLALKKQSMERQEQFEEEARGEIKKKYWVK